MTRSSSRTLRLTVEGPEPVVRDVVVEDLVGGTAPPAHPGPEVRPLAPRAGDLEAGIERVEVTVDGWVLRVAVTSAARADLIARASQAAERRSGAASEAVRARIPGRVVRVWVADGDLVDAGARLLAIEAMKMENEVRAPRAGTVSAIRVAVGQGVELGDELLTLG